MLDYKISVTANKVWLEDIYRTTSVADAISFFNEYKDTNEVVLPRKFVIYPTLSPVKHELLLIQKDYKKTTKVIEENGYKFKRMDLDPNWTIMNKVEWKVEEIFTVHDIGNKTTSKLTIQGIIQEILKPKTSEPKNIIQLVTVNHRLLIIDDNLVVVNCKCEEDSKRLYNKIVELSMKDKTNKCYMLCGHAFGGDKMMFNKLLHEKTGWSMRKIWRKSTDTSFLKVNYSS